ncbi:MAG: HAMP domain-containing histidine kinase [Chloroflexi bacterium]|nr:HAMP domain-containing histidine kinase [Chloroflexota bacterium]
MPNPLHVLVVEDGPAGAGEVLIALRQAGFEPHYEQLSGDLAARLGNGPRPDLVVLAAGRPVASEMELAELRDRLQDLDRLKAKFMADISHELRTPVSNLSLYLHLLENGPAEKRERYLAVLKEQITRLVTLLDDTLFLSRLEPDELEVTFERVDLNELVETLLPAYREQAKLADLALAFRPGQALPPVRGQASQLGQVVAQLLENAISYTPAGRVEIQTYLGRPGEVCLEVADTGDGIAPEDMPYLFERFYRGRNAGQGRIPGTGLGLTVVQAIVNAHGGRIQIQSQAGSGSSFQVSLPAWPEHEDAPDMPQVVPDTGQQVSIY